MLDETIKFQEKCFGCIDKNLFRPYRFKSYIIPFTSLLKMLSSNSIYSVYTSSHKLLNQKLLYKLLSL